MNLDYLLILLNEIDNTDQEEQCLQDREAKSPYESLQAELNSAPMRSKSLLSGSPSSLTTASQSLESYLEQLVENIFKLQYWELEQGRNYKYWQTMVSNSRSSIQRLIKHSPSLKRHMKQIYPELYQNAVNLWQIEFYIPENAPIDLEQILETNYFG